MLFCYVSLIDAFDFYYKMMSNQQFLNTSPTVILSFTFLTNICFNNFFAYELIELHIDFLNSKIPFFTFSNISESSEPLNGGYPDSII